MECPICLDSNIVRKHAADASDVFEIDCPQCGKFSMDRTFWAEAKDVFSNDPIAKQGLPLFIKAENAEGRRPPIDRYKWQQLGIRSMPLSLGGTP